MVEKTPGETVKEFLRRRAALTKQQSETYRVRMTGSPKTNRQIGETIGEHENNVRQNIQAIRRRGLPVREALRPSQPVIPAVGDATIAQKQRHTSEWARQLGVRQPQDDAERPIVVKGSKVGVISRNEIGDTWKHLFERNGRAVSRTKILLAESVRLGLISLRDLAKQFNLHEETILSWIERLSNSGTSKLMADFPRDADITPLCAKMLTEAQGSNAPINVGIAEFDPVSRICKLGAQEIKLDVLEARLLLAISLFPGFFVDIETLYSFIYSDVPANERPETRIVDIISTKLKKKLPILHMESLKGFGIRLVPGSPTDI